MHRILPRRIVSGGAAAVLLAFLVFRPGGVVVAADGELRAGAAIVDVTPTSYPVIVNAMFTERTATNAVDPLYVRALALDDGSTRMVLAIVDTCMIPRDLIDRAKERASRATGVPVNRMLVSATHTHSAPSAMGCLGSRVDTNYAVFLEPRIAGAIADAVSRLQPARIGWGSVDDWEHTFNRRWIRRPDRMLTDPFGEQTVRAHMHPGYDSPDAVGPSGPVDPELSVVAVQTKDGRPLALLANYSQHYYDSPLLSSDYFGRFCRHIAALLNADGKGSDPGFVAMISQGTSGDLARMDYGGAASNVGYDAYARQLAEKAAGVVRGMTFHEWTPLGMAERTLALKYRTPDDARLASSRRIVDRLGGRLPRTQPEIYALESIFLHERQKTELKLQAMRIGELGIAAIPNEVYAITGLKLKAQSPLATTFNIELANGAEGYIPPPEQHKLGGYTTWAARTAGLETEAEPRIVESLLSLLEEVSGKSRRAMAETDGPYPKAVVASNPSAYWRLSEAVMPVAHDATGKGHDGTYEDGVALFLPGASQTIGFQPPQPETPNGFSGNQINRAPHFAGGRMRAAVTLGENYSVELWFWNGLPNDARAVTGYFFSRGEDRDANAAGDHLGIGGSLQADQTGRLIFFNGNRKNTVLAGRTVIERRQWHHVALVREGRRVSVYLNGNRSPELVGEAEVTRAPDEPHLVFGGRCDGFANWEGKLDEIAVYPRALSTGEVSAHYRASGFSPRPPKETASTVTSLPLAPAESLAKIHVPDGFKVQLVAAEPLLESPVAIDWDERGRMWVVEMVDYPLGLDGKGAPGGRVRVLEDSDGDGRYDKTTLFADGLKFPTGLLTWRDGVLVTAAPEILFLKDSDGDGKADVRQVLFSGFLEGNQQLRVNGLRWGLDNWVYCASGAHHGGYGSSTKIKSHLDGREYEVGSRDFRFRPDTGELEAQSGPSQFGRNPDDWGNWFGVQNSWPLWHYVLQEQYIRRNPHVPAPNPVQQVVTPKNPRVFPASQREKRFHSFNEAGHFTSACAAMIYRDELLFGAGNSRHAFTCEPFHNLVQHNVITDDGVSFASHRASEGSAYDFFASEDRWCRPVMTRAGPDGALWVVDMYRYMIEHPEWLPPEGKAELLPHYRLGEERGRVYRVVPDRKNSRLMVRLGDLSLRDVVAALDSPNGWQRDKAQMLLLWRQDPAAVPLLETLAREAANPLARLHALCTLDGLDQLGADLVERALADPHPGVRINALRLAERHSGPKVMAAATRLVTDTDPKVQLQLACTLGQWSDPGAGLALGKLAVSTVGDRFITAAILSSALPHNRALVEAVTAAGGDALSVYAEPLIALSLATNQREPLATLLQSVLPPKEGRFATPEMTFLAQFLDALARRKTGWRSLMNGGGQDALASRLRSMPEAFIAAKRIAENETEAEPTRVAAMGLLAREDSYRADAIPLLAKLLSPRTSVEGQRGALKALAFTGRPEIPAVLAEAWTSLGPEIRLAALDEMLSREAWAMALVGLIEQGRISPGAFDASRRGRLLRHSASGVKEAAARIFATGVTSSRAEVVRQYRPALALDGSPARGMAIFHRLCVTCHKRGDLGNDVGPNLQSVVNHPSEKLIVSILDPNASIEPGYAAYTARLTDGEELYGIIAAETGNSMVMKLADGTTRTLLRSSIASLRSANLSLMPEGLETGLSPQDLADLIRFLQSP